MNRPLRNINSSQDRPLFKSKGAIPLGCTHGLAFVGEVSVPGGILSLIRQKNPADIARFVISVCINSVDRVVRGWFVSHVGQKSRKTTSLIPLGAHAYAACAVVLVLWNLRVVAAASDINPSSIFSRPTTEMGVSVLSRSAQSLLVIAPAGSRPSAPELATVNDGLISANASAQPLDLTGLVALRSDGRESSEYFSRDVFSDLHNAVIPNTRSSRVVLETMKLREHRLSGYPPIQRNQTTAMVETVNT
jgi:hypothetical protein